MINWFIALSEFKIQYKPRLSPKGQVIADFIAETPEQCEEQTSDPWITYVDGASRQSGVGVGIVIQSPTREIIEQVVRLGFPASNNEAEYEAALVGLNLLKALGAQNVLLRSDSQLIVSQLMGEYDTHDERMAKYLALARIRLKSQAK